MEDQQPAAGDLTADAEESADTPTKSDAEADEEAEATTVTEATDEAEEAGETEVSGTESAVGDKGKRPRRKLLAGKRLAIVIALAAAMFVGSAAFAGAMVQPYLTDRAAAATKLKVARTAANAVRALWTYTPEDMDKLADRAAGYLSGDFEANYRKFVDAIAAPNKQAKVTNNTEVTGAAVESLDDPNAVVIVYTNTTSTSPLSKNIPSLKYFSYRLFMKRTDSRWLVTRMTTITSLDLTPHV
ncbi:mammalian cell entry protein [Mycobacterium alsense]|uniref:Mammalian cell entry protein n=1 Tax=Mycobacterium alsense TaxID=324058 RepID=A0AA41XL92_9MYCO|nr:mammalian cell entry protein [Mycobacterium alsense]MCV7378231.1 mammalian cell entry protein [Mycobacterium alsense]OQZ88262.1 mammalian cell entry protein [Mycobacterium alsense]